MPNAIVIPRRLKTLSGVNSDADRDTGTEGDSNAPPCCPGIPDAPAIETGYSDMVLIYEDHGVFVLPTRAFALWPGRYKININNFF
jgi:hypothetical protein